MHISDGLLHPAVCAAGYGLSVALMGRALKTLKEKDIPKISVMGAFFFATSMIAPFRLGVVSVHLMFVGILGLVLGFNSVLAIFAGLFFQAVMFQHGGVTTLGVNTLVMSFPSIVVYYVFLFITKRAKFSSFAICLFASILAFFAIFLSASVVGIILLISGEEFSGLIAVFSFSYLFLGIIEGILTFFVMMMVLKIKPDIIQAYRKI